MIKFLTVANSIVNISKEFNDFLESSGLLIEVDSEDMASAIKYKNI